MEEYVVNFSDVSVPEVYKESIDFRFFLNWFESALTRIKYDTENMIDLYDPLKCPSQLLWMLADTMGYKFDDRLPTAFNRLVLLYFMSMIYNRGSKTGMILAAELNVAQFNIKKYGQENEVLFDRLEDTNIPVNSASVTSVPDAGYIDVVYLSTEKPVDACIEYVRPVGMYCFQHAGVFVNAKSKISVDARLTNSRDMHLTIGPTRVNKYRRSDFATMQKMHDESNQIVNHEDKRNQWYYRNMDAEAAPMQNDNPGYRTLSSFQMANNTHIVEATLQDPIFSLGYSVDDVEVSKPNEYLDARKAYNLTYNRRVEESLSLDISTLDKSKENSESSNPYPKIAPVMMGMGDAIAIDTTRTKYTNVEEDGSITVEKHR